MSHWVLHTPLNLQYHQDEITSEETSYVYMYRIKYRNKILQKYNQINIQQGDY